MDSSSVAAGKCARHSCPSSTGDVTLLALPPDSHLNDDETLMHNKGDIPLQICTLQLTQTKQNNCRTSSALPSPSPISTSLSTSSSSSSSTSSAPSSPTSSSPSSLSPSKKSSILTKMSHLISRNPVSLTVTLCLIVLFLFFVFTFGPLTALAAKSHTPAALIGFFESDFSRKTSPEEETNFEPELEDRSKSKDSTDTDDIFIESPSPSSFNDAEDYDRPETALVHKVNYDEDDEPSSPSHAKLVDSQSTATSKNRPEISQEQISRFLHYLALKAARTRTNSYGQLPQSDRQPDVFSVSPRRTTTTEMPPTVVSIRPFIQYHNSTPRFVVPKARDLTQPSERIAQLFEDFRTSNSRISRENRFDTDSTSQPKTQRICGEIFNISTSVEISSPNYPNKYSPDLKCQWEVIARPTQTLRVQIFKLNIERDEKCRFDHLDIKGMLQTNKHPKEAMERTKRYCGSNSDQEIRIFSNRVIISFHSDSNNELTGFFLRVIADSRDCPSQVHVLNSTYITSPNYPKSYGDSEACWTLVTAEPNHRLFVQFEELRLEPDPKCNLDYVEIHDGPIANASNSRGRWCTKPKNSTAGIHSTDNSLVFHFESDGYVTYVGYKARVVSLRKDVDVRSYSKCNWNADWQNMTISSPFYPDRYPLGTECQTSITSSSPEEKIIILFDWIDLNDNVLPTENSVARSQNQPLASSPNVCLSDRLEIWDSLSDTVPSKVFCGYRNEQFKYVSKSNSIRLVFKSAMYLDESHDRHRSQDAGPNNNPGFKARFTFTNNKPSVGKTDPSNANEFSDLTTSQFGSENGSGEHNVILLRKPENASVMIGSSHILFCDVAHFPDGEKPEITWFKGDRELHEGVSSDRTSLLIQQFLPSSIGRYICVYGNSSSDAYLTATESEIQCSGPNVLYRERPKDQYTTEGEFVMLQCSVTESDPLTGETNAKIIWKKMDIQSGGELKPVEFNSRIKILRGGIIFDPALVDDSGFYFCVVDRNTTESKDCIIKSAARVQINSRVDVNQYCGRAVIPQKAAEHSRRESMSDYGKIIGGTEATPGEFPWMVMFWDDKRHVFCGGALLNERWVITAAHCFTDATDQSTIFVKLGKNDQSADEPTEIVTKIQDIIKHPNFSKDTFDNDIALIKLQKHITFSNYIVPICLPSSSEQVEAMKQYFFNDSADSSDMSETGFGKYGYVTGWGRLKESGPLPRFLHKIRLPIVEDRKCHEMTAFKVTENMFCAGYGKEIVGDACKGDSGGPFTVQFDNRWTLLGVVSWGEGCGRQEKYGYYTKVNNYISWIRRLTRHTY